MATQPSWHPLPVLGVDVPALLVSSLFSLDPVSYTVHVTDLANMWSESLKRRAIIVRSYKEDASIDPSEDPTNMSKFLNYLQAAFGPKNDEHVNTSLSLSVAEDGGLVLHVTCILPSPFKPLKWPMYLKKCPASTLTTELVLPLIQALYARAREVDALVVFLKQKDSALAKFVDKVDSWGGWDSIFPQLGTHRRPTRAHAEDRVKGLVPFSDSKFRRDMSKSEDEQSAGLLNLLQGVFGGDTGLACRSDVLGVNDATPLNDWWTKLKVGTSVPLVERKRDVEKRRGSTVAGKTRDFETATAAAGGRGATTRDDDDDDFQVQATPPHLMSKSQRRTKSKFTGTTAAGPEHDTTDEGVGGGPSTIPDSNQTPHSSQHQQVKAEPSRLGTIGGLKRKGTAASNRPVSPLSPDPSAPTPPSPEQAAEQPDNDDSETASEADEAPKPSLSPKTKPTPSKKGGGLGRLGGARGKKSKAPSPELEAASPPPQDDGKECSSSPHVPDSSQQSQPTAKPAGTKRRLGQLGGGRKKTPAPSVPNPEAENSRAVSAIHRGDRGRSVEKMDVDNEHKEEKPHETSVERADRKRLELQRELNKKAAAGPAKKKRRF